MTAIVGILNKRAVAVATDSAVTIDCQSGHKVLNSARKLFQLSKKEPVGIMIYSSANFMETPWELIISLYREHLGDSAYDSLQEYVDDFVSFIRDKHFFCSAEMKKRYLMRQMDFFYNDVKRMAYTRCIGKNGEKQIPDRVLHEEMIHIFNEHIDFYKSLDKCLDFNDYSLKAFQTDAQEELKELAKCYNLQGEDLEIYEESFFTYLCSVHIAFDMTGLVFVGYGKSEIYPSLIPFNISFTIDERIKGALDKPRVQTITDFNNAAICPFAQKDVMMTFMTGIDEDIKQFTFDAASKCINDYKNYICSILSVDEKDRSAKETVETLDASTFVGFFKAQVDEFIQNAYIRKLVDTVAYLEKDDIANMAENLILLTGLKRRITSSEETVGGPVDVAIISKDDGFIWIKKKQYFDKELNPHYCSHFK
ncbi:hypothetical protein [Methanobrevibacter sp.]|uniref:hypothetical protein n=1 Tax=Methanobrevibacter sp. TaxID=66852 RepID=UPI003868C7E9